MLSEAKHLLLLEHVGDKQILRFAQNDKRRAPFDFAQGRQGRRGSDWLFPIPSPPAHPKSAYKNCARLSKRL